MIVGIGSDLIDIARIERAIERARFLERVYTAKERQRINQRGAQTAAGLFAAKEAVAKALGCGFRGFFADAIEITHDELDKPLCTLHGGALERLNAIGGMRVHVSISHAAGFAQAFAIIEDGPSSQMEPKRMQRVKAVTDQHQPKSTSLKENAP